MTFIQKPDVRSNQIILPFLRVVRLFGYLAVWTALCCPVALWVIETKAYVGEAVALFKLLKLT